MWIKSKGALSSDQQQFSCSLRVSPYKSYNKPVIFVLRFYENVDSSRPSSSVKLGGGSVGAAGVLILHLPSATELDMEMDTHDAVIHEEDLLPKTRSLNDRDVLASCEGSSSKSNQLGDFSLKEA